MNYNKLKGKLRERGETYEKCARALGISVASFNSKMNGKNKFYIDELDVLGKYLEMNDGEKIKIFLH